MRSAGVLRVSKEFILVTAAILVILAVGVPNNKALRAGSPASVNMLPAAVWPYYVYWPRKYSNGRTAGFISDFTNYNHPVTRAAYTDATGLHVIMNSPQGFTTNAVAIDGTGKVYGNEIKDALVALPDSSLFSFESGSYVNLGTILPSFPHAEIISMNAGGSIVGKVDNYSPNNWVEKGFLIPSDSSPVDLGSFIPVAINNAGHIAGKSQGSAPWLRLVVGGTNFSIDAALPSNINSPSIAALNDHDVVVVIAQSNADHLQHHYLVTNVANRTSIDMGFPANNPNYITTSINNCNEAVGRMWGSDFNQRHGFIYRNGAYTDLNTLFPVPAGYYISDADQIGDDGTILAGLKSNPNSNAVYAILKPAVSGLAMLDNGRCGGTLAEAATAVDATVSQLQ